MNWKDLRAFAASCTSLGVAVPEPVVRGLELATIANSTVVEQEATPLLSLDATQLQERIESIAVRSHSASSLGAGSGLQPGVNEVLASLGTEVRVATIPYLESLIEELQPQFDTQVAPLSDAVCRFGFTYSTSSDDVINQDDPEAIEAWRAVRQSWFGMAPIVSFRISLTRLFGVAPTERDMRAARPMFRGRRGPTFVDNSVMFAAGDNWSVDGESYIEPDLPRNIDWLRLAAGGLRLNTPDDVLTKIQKRRTDRLAAIAP